MRGCIEKRTVRIGRFVFVVGCHGEGKKVYVDCNIHKFRDVHIWEVNFIAGLKLLNKLMNFSSLSLDNSVIPMSSMCLCICLKTIFLHIFVIPCIRSDP